jgi:hypothetical protein
VLVLQRDRSAQVDWDLVGLGQRSGRHPEFLGQHLGSPVNRE